ncbi:hypothetical protein B0H94_1164 [Salsuginibacillus halophilus]|uniref:LysM domain-containing protein n=1 Tax=Salsuginibacillus halophilus TaxID=517424 RepID=A0A2P8H7U8_9BACI|nr:LysM domain-containing protein [Salsuginibacillus halophilus]PSL42305.1 hypothetical protein B0H94_1164 [Salsuginibacillus halophilus]
MKKWLWLFAVITIGLAVTYDLQQGTLPSSHEPVVKTDTTAVDADYIKHEVQPGETVLTIVEKIHHTQPPVSIEEIQTDFTALNNGQAPKHIQPGTAYRFPLYHESD